MIVCCHAKGQIGGRRSKGMSRDEDELDDGEEEELEEGPEEEAPERGWAPEAPGRTVHVETGRGVGVEVPVGSPFVETVERIAAEANYGGYFRVFLGGSELLERGVAPETIEEGQRITITAYDKVGRS